MLLTLGVESLSKLGGPLNGEQFHGTGRPV